MNKTLVERLFVLADARYARFSAGLIPDAEPERILGVSSPRLRALAKEMSEEEKAVFINTPSHYYHEENMLHAIIINGMRSPERIFDALEAFLPYVDNWAVCDCLRPVRLKKCPQELLFFIRRCIDSSHVYTLRFAVEMLMTYFLDELYQPEYPAMVAGIKSDEYYVNMMLAWYFATALAKRWDDVICYIEEYRLSPWVHNKTIQKARESYRISPEQKEYLKGLRIARGSIDNRG